MHAKPLLIIAGVVCLAAALGMQADNQEQTPEARHVAQLIQKLGDDHFSVREQATRELESLGEAAVAPLRRAAGSDENFEIRWRAQKILFAPSRKSLSTGLALVIVRAGEFYMGSPEQEAGRRSDEARHKVRLSKPFYIGAYEVTQDEYRQVMVASPSWFASSGGGASRTEGKETKRFPIEHVTWFDALAFCNRLSQLDRFEPYYRLENVRREGDSISAAEVTVLGGIGYRLPTEAEWEFACRAGTETPFHFGAGSNGHGANLKGISREGGYGGVIKGPDLGRTTTVGCYAANEWGLFDMHGNVGEWCWDCFDGEYYLHSPRVDPAGPARGEQRGVRGGSWLVNEPSCRSASRLGVAPDTRKDYIGFRVARDP
jgi:sulfatase modifying factor 1